MSRSFRFTSAALAFVAALFGYDRSEHTYDIPAVTLIDQAGRSVQADRLFGARESVVVQFIFTTCSTICPIMTATLVAARKDQAVAATRFVSITIDPEHDTPPRLAAYASRFHADDRWLFLTGSAPDIAALLRAFDADPANGKMSHRPLTFLRPASARSWIRLDGLSSATDLIAEFRAAAVRAGKRIYREGILPATVAGDVPLSPVEARCGACHRLSGFGGWEGGTKVPPIVGDLLFQPAALARPFNAAPLFEDASTLDLRAGVRSARGRPAYAVHNLATALRDGVDPAGRQFDSAMPRYLIDDSDVAALAAYLAALGAGPTPGLDPDAIHFATILAGNVDPVDRASLRCVAQAWIANQNREALRLRGRTERIAWDRVDEFANARPWALHIWELTGPPATWTAQLENFYARQPVFAIVASIAAGPWQPVADFCDRSETPCLFPDAALPAKPAPTSNTVYFSGGVIAEAEALASYLGDQRPLVQVFAQSPLAAAAADAFRALRPSVVSIPLPADPPAAAWWRALPRSTALIAWAPAAHLQSLDCDSLRTTFYVSATLSGDPAPCRSAGLVSTAAVGANSSLERARLRNWLLSRGVPPGSERIQLNAVFALNLVDDCLRRMSGRFSRDYLLETIERTAETAPNPGIYPRLSLGPGQRVASKGAWIVLPQASGAQNIWQTLSH